jgi:hypothetical protein
MPKSYPARTGHNQGHKRTLERVLAGYSPGYRTTIPVELVPSPRNPTGYKADTVGYRVNDAQTVAD